MIEKLNGILTLLYGVYHKQWFMQNKNIIKLFVVNLADNDLFVRTTSPNSLNAKQVNLFNNMKIKLNNKSVYHLWETFLWLNLLISVVLEITTQFCFYKLQIISERSSIKFYCVFKVAIRNKG